MAKLCLTLGALSVLSLALAQVQTPGAGYHYGPVNRESPALELPSNASSNVTAADTDLPNRIVGGVPINIAQAPYQVAVLRDSRFTCGGSIVAQRWVLTAAHCVQPKGIYKIRAGSRSFRTGGQLIVVARIAIYGKYNAGTQVHDIALLQLATPLTFNRFVQPVKLAALNAKLPKVYTITGWGTQTASSQGASATLLSAQVVHIDNFKCSFLYNGQVTITQTMICAAYPGKDTCQGDSGGALVSGGVQYGIVSFGIGCANKLYPGIYTDVRFYIQWIKNVQSKF